MSRSLPTSGRVDVLEGAGVGGDPGDVHPAPCGRRRCGRRRARRGRRRRCRARRGSGRSAVSVASCSGADHVEAHLQLQRRQDRGEVGVAAALAVAVDGALDQPRPGFDRGQRVGDARTRRRCGCGCRARPAPRAASTTAAVAAATKSRQAAAVGVAEGDVLGAAVDRRPQALERVAGVVAVAVEEVLGVVDDPLALLAAEADRVGDHRQVLLAARPGSPSPGAGPRSCRPG